MKGRYLSIHLILVMIALTTNSCNDDITYLPTLTTNDLKAIDVNNAISGGNITDDGSSTIIARGVCWNTIAQPSLKHNYTLNGNGTGEYLSRLDGLSPNTQYYVRAYATNSEGTAYGNELSFTTKSSFSCGNSISDYEGNIYQTVNIGNQCWMVENLTTSYYYDGTIIPTNLSNSAWINATTAAYATYGNDEILNSTYGKLYNWHAVNTQKICPKRWHIPTIEEWNILINYLSVESDAGGKMKSTNHWNAPNANATNSSGFTGLPGGYRFDIRISPNVGYYGNYWSATSNTDFTASSISLSYSNSYVGKAINGMVNGLSCRCVKD